MKRNLIAFACVMMLAFPLAGCGSSNNNADSSSAAPSMEITLNNGTTEAPDTEITASQVIDDIEDIEKVEESLGQLNIKKDLDKTVAVFEFTEAEEKAYGEFAKAHDKSVFKDMEPMSIAKIWIQYGIQFDWESDFEMLCKDENLTVTKDDFRKLHSIDRLQSKSLEEQGMESLSRQEFAKTVFSDLEKGEFVKTSDTEGHILFKESGKTDVWLNFKQVTPGIWEVVYLPVITDPLS